MNEERIKEVFSDEGFVKELFSKETPEEAQAMLAEKDIDVTTEELITLKELLEKQLQNADSGEELGDDDLEDVSGGVFLIGATFALLGATIVASFVACELKEKGIKW